MPVRRGANECIIDDGRAGEGLIAYLSRNAAACYAAEERLGNDKDDEELEQLDNEDEIDAVMLTEVRSLLQRRWRTGA